MLFLTAIPWYLLQQLQELAFQQVVPNMCMIQIANLTGISSLITTLVFDILHFLRLPKTDDVFIFWSPLPLYLPALCKYFEFRVYSLAYRCLTWIIVVFFWNIMSTLILCNRILLLLRYLGAYFYLRATRRSVSFRVVTFSICFFSLLFSLIVSL